MIMIITRRCSSFRRNCGRGKYTTPPGSEEERIRLEERFNMLMRESRNRHDACISRLRMRYIQYLEEQRTRDERNHKLLAALDKVMNKLALMSAKKDRLNVLRKQYEAYLLRVYSNHRPPGSVTGDSGIASQNEDKYTKKTVGVAYPDLAFAETRGVPSPRVPDPQLNQPKFHVNSVPLNNSSILTTTSANVPLGVDHRQMNALHRSHVYIPPIGQTGDQLAQMSTISSPSAQYPRVIPSRYDESNLQRVPDLRVSYAEAPVLSMPRSDNTQSNVIPVSRFFRKHVESEQAASGLSSTARYGEIPRNIPVAQPIDPLLRYHDANILPSQLRMREYDPSEIAAAGPTSVTGKSSVYRAGSDVNQIGPLPGYMDYILASPQKSDDEGSIRSITSDDLDDLRLNERLLWGNADVGKTSSRSSNALGMNNVNLDENGKTAILENELDRYINNIRKLHREHGSLDELDHEQNTSGDLLNVSLSEDALELPAEDRAKKERMPEEMGRILALASDLASRTANLKEVTRNPAEQNDGSSPTEVGNEIRHREVTKTDASELKGKCEAEGRAILAGNEIREDIATHSAKLEQPHGNTEIAKQTWNNAGDSADSQDRNREISITKKDNVNMKITTSDESQINDLEKALKEKQHDLVTGEESNIEDLFDVVEELAPWDLSSMQRKVHELHLDDPDRNQVAGKDTEQIVDKIREEIGNESRESPQFTEQIDTKNEVENAHLPQNTLPCSELETKRLDTNEVNELDGRNENELRELPENTENVSPKLPSQYTVDEPKIASQADEELGKLDESDREKQADNETAELRTDDKFENVIKDNEYNVEQGYVEDSNQAQQYEQDPNQQYYDPNISYEAAGNEEYERYGEQGYAQEGQEYVEYVEGQYEQYPEGPSNQEYQHYPDAQYEQDPNRAYDYNYDPNQGYGDPNQQYDPNQGYENNPDNQTYDYTEEVPYDPNQTYDNAYEQDYKEGQANPDAEEQEEKPETEETFQKPADPESEHKSDRDEDKSQQAAAVDGTSQSKKKKDVIKSLLDSDTDTTIERNVSNTESDFDFN
ncbi:uncharacterized protein LOC105427001 isoform X2 [Pogonomyrmex barbatus]|uniref:Uncharacterized protein LOC105427001 isoform X2 n=1 Tax=Pogonomyrmex barbatus TaxID=144034 RepID=A0A6I9W5L1_9HYME|nr:uncharacterized protein LOC105427001 isoform X2 [Pogonomyrmex barbatus]